MVRCIPASTSRPIRIVQVTVTRLMSQSPAADPSSAPAASQVHSTS